MTDRLKPCPFCGGELKKDRWGFYVHGRNACILTCFEVEPEEEEIEKWNTRKPMDRIVEELGSQCSKTVSMGRMDGKTLTAGFNLGILNAIEIVKGEQNE